MDESGSVVLNFEAEDMFPSLQGNNSSNSASTTSTSSGTSYASPAATTTIAGVSSLAMNFARAVSLQPATPSPALSLGFDAGGYSSAAQRRPPPPPLPSHRPLYHKDAYSANERWVATGEAVASQYLELREEAYQLSCARNKCFMGATQAYRRCGVAAVVRWGVASTWRCKLTYRGGWGVGSGPVVATSRS